MYNKQIIPQRNPSKIIHEGSYELPHGEKTPDSMEKIKEIFYRATNQYCPHD